MLSWEPRVSRESDLLWPPLFRNVRSSSGHVLSRSTPAVDIARSPWPPVFGFWTSGARQMQKSCLLRGTTGYGASSSSESGAIRSAITDDSAAGREQPSALT